MNNTYSTAVPAPIRVFADWQLMSEMRGRPWMTETLTEAVRAGLIDKFEVVKVSIGTHGLQYIFFTVDLTLDVADMAYAEVQKKVESLLNKIVGDTDVDVRWIAPITEV